MEKLAIIDLGCSKIDLIIASYSPEGNFVIEYEKSENVHLIEDFDGEAMLRTSKSNEAISVLKTYKVLCGVKRVSNIIVYTTECIKNLKNYRSFVDEVYNNVGFKVSILSQDEELSALYTGIINSLDIPKGVIVNISGDCVRFVQYNRRNILNKAEIMLGTYEIAKIMEQEKNTEKALNLMKEKFLEQLRGIDWLKSVEDEFAFIGTGNAFFSSGILARKIRKYPVDLPHNYELSFDEYKKVFDLIKTFEIDKTKRIKGVSGDRADVFASGVAIIGALFEVLNNRTCVLSARGMKEGFIYSNIPAINLDKPIPDILGFSLDSIEEYYDAPMMQTAKHICDLSLILFRQLKVLHKLPRNYIKVLRIASTLYACGKRISFYNYERNSFEIVLNSDILGATHREIVLAAFVCASQNLNDFSLAEWIKYKDLLVDEDLDAMRKLALIVRLAKALDFSGRAIVQDISCDILGDSVIMKTIITMNADIEIKEALRSASDFKKVYKKSLEVL